MRIVKASEVGEQAVEQLRHAFGRRCRPGMAGMKLSFEVQRTGEARSRAAT